MGHYRVVKLLETLKGWKFVIVFNIELLTVLNSLNGSQRAFMTGSFVVVFLPGKAKFTVKFSKKGEKRYFTSYIICNCGNH